LKTSNDRTTSKPGRLDYKETKARAERYCAYQERTQKEVRDKLYSLQADSNDIEPIISELITAGFINEVRFARQFAGGKFRIKKWGRNKIVREMKAKGLSSACINEGLKEIDEADYQETLEALAKNKFESTPGTDAFIRRQKTFRFLANKGYESDLISGVMASLDA